MQEKKRGIIYLLHRDFRYFYTTNIRFDMSDYVKEWMKDAKRAFVSSRYKEAMETLEGVLRVEPSVRPIRRLSGTFISPSSIYVIQSIL